LPRRKGKSKPICSTTSILR